MTDFLVACRNFFDGLSQASFAVVQAVHAIGAYNYNLVTSVFRCLYDASVVIATLVSSLVGAAINIICYISDFLTTILHFVNIFLGYLSKVAVFICQYLQIGFSAVAGVVQQIVQFIIHCGSSMLYGLSVLGEVLLGVCGNVCENFRKLCQSGDAPPGKIGTPPVGKRFAHADIHASSTSTWEYMRNGLSQVYVSNLQHLYYVFDASKASSLVLLDFIYHTVTLDISLYILLGSLFIFILRWILDRLHKRGMTFPLLPHRPPRRRLPYDVYHFDSSDAESEDEDAEEGDDEGDDDESDEAEDEEEEDESEDEVEEYEVVSDSDEAAEDEDDEEEEDDEIDVQLPQTAGRYNLRTRPTPPPIFTDAKLSPAELERVLETERDRRMCVVCQDQVKTVLVLPCRHLCLCIDCAHEIAHSRNQARRVCPMCRTRMETVMNIYI